MEMKPGDRVAIPMSSRGLNWSNKRLWTTAARQLCRGIVLCECDDTSCYCNAHGMRRDWQRTDAAAHAASHAANTPAGLPALRGDGHASVNMSDREQRHLNRKPVSFNVWTDSFGIVCLDCQ